MCLVTSTTFKMEGDWLKRTSIKTNQKVKKLKGVMAPPGENIHIGKVGFKILLWLWSYTTIAMWPSAKISYYVW